jgi:hypothetical protein
MKIELGEEKMVRRVVIFLLSIGMVLPARAQFVSNVSKAGTTAASFLEIGVGARAIGMGGAFVATASDASAIYWNPGGLARLQRPEVLFVHTQWLAGMSFDFAGVVIPLGSFGVIGGSVTALSMDELRVRTVERPQGTGEFFDAGDLALTTSYALALTDRFSIGFNAKYIRQSIWKESAEAFAVDFGTLFDTGFKGLRIGAALTNFGTEMRMMGDDMLVFYDPDPNKLGNNDQIIAELKADSWPLPLTFQGGLAMEIPHGNSSALTVAVEATHPSDNTESIHMGVEYNFRNSFFLRGGYRDLFLRDGEATFTLGAGLYLNLVGNTRVKLDYAYADFGRLENVQRFSFAVVF